MKVEGRNQHNQHESNLPDGLSAPARRALAAAGIERLDQLAEMIEAELKKLHGIGPNAIHRLINALAANGMSFADEKSKVRR